ncbi:hypothetical protein ABFA07_000162 [Porites harrisoni]
MTQRKEHETTQGFMTRRRYRFRETVKQEFQQSSITFLKRVISNLVVNGAPCVILNVNFHCNVQETLWCDDPDT